MTNQLTPVVGMWNPDRYAVLVTLLADDTLRVACMCGAVAVVHHWPDAQAWRRGHRCPPGSPGSWPTCPTCEATGRACVSGNRVRGRGIAGWHPARVYVYRAVVGREPRAVPGDDWDDE